MDPLLFLSFFSLETEVLPTREALVDELVFGFASSKILILSFLWLVPSVFLIALPISLEELSLKFLDDLLILPIMWREMTLVVTKDIFYREFSRISGDYYAPMNIGERYIIGIQAHIPNLDCLIPITCSVVRTYFDHLENWRVVS